MSIELTLLPIDPPIDGVPPFSRTALYVEMNHDLCKALAPIPFRWDLDGLISLMKEDGCTDEDAYGTPLVSVSRENLVKAVSKAPFVGCPLWNAARAYLKALPADTRVALYWH